MGAREQDTWVSSLPWEGKGDEGLKQREWGLEPGLLGSFSRFGRGVGGWGVRGGSPDTLPSPPPTHPGAPSH